ncbi:MAG: iron-containing alcohol dehydrogenase [Desulfobacteraceae bacterium]|nr:MAG: iron-containing alcohol dehydrogenase [Desulfobacteraceae bacterium]
MHFSFATANNIRFGTGMLAQAVSEAAQLGRRALLVTGRNPDRAHDFGLRLEKAGIETLRFSISGEPEIEQVAAGAVLARQAQCDLVIGFGGGSALDGAKAIAALAVNPGPVETYLEVIGQGQPLQHAPLPCIAIPTTAGTGSEVTRNAVIKSTRHKVKVSLRSPRMLPTWALVDPELTLSLPRGITAATGCDALTQLLEAFVSTKANPITDALCREGLARAGPALPRAAAQGNDLAARTDMALASLFSGLALANAGLGAVHGIAGPLGGMIEGPHGALCARLLPHVIEANIKALSSNKQPRHCALARYAQAARLLTGSPRASMVDGVGWLHQLIRQLDIPGLHHWGLSVEAVPDLVARAQRASSMKTNPAPLTDNEVTEIVLKAM